MKKFKFLADAYLAASNRLEYLESGQQSIQRRYDRGLATEEQARQEFAEAEQQIKVATLDVIKTEQALKIATHAGAESPEMGEQVFKVAVGQAKEDERIRWERYIDGPKDGPDTPPKSGGSDSGGAGGGQLMAGKAATVQAQVSEVSAQTWSLAEQYANLTGSDAKARERTALLEANREVEREQRLKRQREREELAKARALEGVDTPDH